MSIKVNKLNYLVIDIPNTEAVKDCQISSAKDSQVGSYYTNDNEEKRKEIFDFFKGQEKKYFLDHLKTNEYIKDVRNRVLPFKSIFKDNLNTLMNIDFFTSNLELKPMETKGENSRYLSFDKEDGNSMELVNILLGKVTLLYIIKNENNYLIYPELKKDFDLHLVNSKKELPVVIENFEEIYNYYFEKQKENWLECFISENWNLSNYLREDSLRTIAEILDIESIKFTNDFKRIVKESSLKNKLKDEHFYGDIPLEETGKSYKSQSENTEFEKVDFNLKLDFAGLYFEDEENLKERISLALRSGKSIILTGAPGTGKSKIANAIVNSYDVESKMVTAMSDWSSYDTIGGYKPRKNGELYFERGIFLNSLKKGDNTQINEWLIIDEINRADIDKSFGPFFSALSGDDIEISLKDNNEFNIEISLEKNNDANVNVRPHQYIVPNDWRLIGTMNTFDKTSLYEMSYAFMRRFAFIQIPIPKNINSNTVSTFLNFWDIELEKEDLDNLSNLWKIINNFRKIGPAIIEDISKYIELGGDYVSSIVMFILPQLEGLFDDELQKFYENVCTLDFIEKHTILKDSMEDFFSINLGE